MKTLSSSWRALAAAVPALVLAFAPAVRANEGWGTDFEAAKATAAKESKDLLMDFTGSDWCGWCIRLNKEVFSKDAFKQDAPKHFVLLELDYPQQKELPKEEKEQNEKLQETYHVEGFPTILLADAKGRPYAKTGYMEGGPEKYNEHLNELRKIRETRDAAFKKADAAEGLDKAKAINEGLKALDPEVVEGYYKDELAKVISLDKDDTLGFKAKKAYSDKRSALDEKLSEFQQNEKTKEFSDAIDEFIKTEKVKGTDLQDLLFTKLQVLGPADMDKADALMDEVIKIDADSDLGKNAANVKKRIVEMRKQVDESKKDDADKGDEKKDDAAPEEKEEKEVK